MIYQNENFNGTLDFRAGIHHGWLIDAHLHEYTELLYCQKGDGTVTVNGKCIRLSENTLVWIPPNYIHQYDCKNADVICAVFSADFIPLFFRAADGRRLIVSPVDVSDIAELLDRLYLLKKESYLLVSGYLNVICAKVMEQSAFEEHRETDGILYQKVISYLSAHYTENISLRYIARKFGYSEKYLSHTLHELTGIHFTRLLSLYRIDCAKKRLLSEKSSNISDIALNCGFSSLNTFNRVFKEMTGMTPSEYRKSCGI